MKKIVKKNDNFGADLWQMWEVPLFGGKRTRVLKLIGDWLKNQSQPKWIATVNPEFIMKTRQDRCFFDILHITDLNVVDGIGLVWAREVNLRSQMSNVRWKRLTIGLKVGIEILQGKYKGQVTAGSDLMVDLCELAGKEKYRVFFLGGWKNRAERTAKYFNDKFQMSNDQIRYSGGAPEVGNEEVLKKINEFKPHILFVAYGMQKQEEWIAENLSKLKIGVVIGVGRSFDYYSGDLKRAPMLWRKIGMEWLYSLIQEPKRWRRQLELLKFVWKVLFG